MLRQVPALQLLIQPGDPAEPVGLDDGGGFRIGGGTLFLRVVQVGNTTLDGALSRRLPGDQPDDGEAQQEKEKEDQHQKEHGLLLLWPGTMLCVPITRGPRNAGAAQAIIGAIPPRRNQAG